MELLRIFISDGHAYFGRHGQPAGTHGIREIDQVDCVAGRGLRGDRFFDYKDDYKGQVTLFSAHVFAELCREFTAFSADPGQLRRNLLVDEADLNALIGAEFAIQGVRFAAVEECRPCYWMNQAIGAGAEAWLRGRGGLRCRALTSGVLHAELPVSASH
jgi:MOSC domain-containing protein YiiM